MSTQIEFFGSPNQWRHWVKTSRHPIARTVLIFFRQTRLWEFPAPKLVFKPCYFLWSGLNGSYHNIMRMLWWTPLFKSRCEHTGSGLYLYGGLPWIAGGLKIRLGHHCRISGQTTLTGRSCSAIVPELIVGNNVDLSWQCTLAVGTRIVLGDNVRIAGQCFLAGYPGHPLNAVARAENSPDDDTQAREIILENDVWLGTGVKVLAGVHIGAGTVVGTGSVVTHDLPAGVIAAGNPARVLRKIG